VICIGFGAIVLDTFDEYERIQEVKKMIGDEVNVT